MRILHVLNELNRIGNGIVNIAVDVACEQKKMGHEVAMASAGGDHEELLARYGITHFTVDQRRALNNVLPCLKKFQSTLSTFMPDVVHAHMVTGLLLAKTLRFHYKYQIISTVHNEFQRSSKLMGMADHVIALSEAGAKHAIKKGASPHRVHVIANGCIGSARNKPLAAYETADVQHPAIVTVAGMYERKGIQDLILAMNELRKNHSDAHLYLVGNGPQIDEFRMLANRHKLNEHVHFVGFHTEPQQYLKACDIFVLASHEEPNSLALIEAREAGCAIVATDVGGNPYILDAGKAGLLVAAQNPVALADAFAKILGNPELSTKLRNDAKMNLDRFRVSRMAANTTDLYVETKK